MEVQTSTKNQPANPIAAQPVEVAAQVVEPNPKAPTTSASKKDSVKAAEKVAGTQAKTNDQDPVLPVVANENAKPIVTETPRTEIESPGFAQNSEENTEDMKGDGLLNKNGPAEVGDVPPQPEDDDEEFNEGDGLLILLLQT